MLTSPEMGINSRLRALRSIRILTTSEDDQSKYLSDFLVLKPDLLVILFNQLQFKDLSIPCLSEVFWILANLAIAHNTARFLIKELKAV